MDSQMLQFAGSLAAIAAVIALAHFLGFSRGGRVATETEARALFALAPGGFETVELCLDEEGRGAIARDSAGRLAVLLPHGGQFVARVLEPGARLTADGDRLSIEGSASGRKPVTLHLGNAAQGWTNQA
ncbi:hypothetical protein AAV99_04870 [Aurantiacibacter marinus]|uniref:Uncharacterized protein n=2 Tax=Aurantiacibacter marinus TaxID=874156 RepID=A0A0H0XY54_9SPHN|nr:hypothetical protein AAV99_04870 [Aurantiacibacter marinus]